MTWPVPAREYGLQDHQSSSKGTTTLRRLRQRLLDDDSDDDTHVAEAFPTDARMRQKEQEARDREAGTLQAKRKAGKRKFHVEDHFDDCGEDLSSIGGEDMDMFVDLIDDVSTSLDDNYNDCDERSRFMFFDDLDQVGCSPQRALCDGVSSTDSISKLFALLTRVGPREFDVVEIMGGERLCSKVAVR